MALTITLPLPPKELNPNGRTHWRAKMKPKQVYRERAWLECVAQPGHAMGLQEATVGVRFYHRTKNHRDPDNIIASLKHAIDGIVRAGVLADDDRLTWLPVERLTDKDNPRVEITIDGKDQR